MTAPLSLLKSSNGMAVKFQKAMNEAMAQGDLDRYQVVAQRLDNAMTAPAFDSTEFIRLCHLYGVEV